MLSKQRLSPRQPSLSLAFLQHLQISIMSPSIVALCCIGDDFLVSILCAKSAEERVVSGMSSGVAKKAACSLTFCYQPCGSIRGQSLLTFSWRPHLSHTTCDSFMGTPQRCSGICCDSRKTPLLHSFCHASHPTPHILGLLHY